MEIKRLEKFKGGGNFSWANYREVAGNATFDNARVVVVAEEHYVRQVKELKFLGLRKPYLEIRWADSRLRVRELLSRHTASGDMMLRESHALGGKYRWRKARNEFGINQGVEVRGWDNMRLVRKCRQWNKRARKAYVRETDTCTYQQADSKVLFYGMQRNDSMHKAITMMERRVAEGNKLYVVAGRAHIIGNYELQRLLSSYNYIILETQDWKDRGNQNNRSNYLGGYP